MNESKIIQNSILDLKSDLKDIKSSIAELIFMFKENDEKLKKLMQFKNQPRFPKFSGVTYQNYESWVHKSYILKISF